jgi:hypothetical protein
MSMKELANSPLDDSIAHAWPGCVRHRIVAVAADVVMNGHAVFVRLSLRLVRVFLRLRLLRRTVRLLTTPTSPLTPSLPSSRFRIVIIAVVASVLLRQLQVESLCSQMLSSSPLPHRTKS